MVRECEYRELKCEFFNGLFLRKRLLKKAVLHRSEHVRCIQAFLVTSFSRKRLRDTKKYWYHDLNISLATDSCNNRKVDPLEVASK